MSDESDELELELDEEVDPGVIHKQATTPTSSRNPYSRLEVNRLIELIEEKETIIENKRTDFNTQNKKNAAWIKLTAEYNSCVDVQKRTQKQLQKKWDNLKSTAKKDVS